MAEIDLGNMVIRRVLICIGGATYTEHDLEKKYHRRYPPALVSSEVVDRPSNVFVEKVSKEQLDFETAFGLLFNEGYICEIKKEGGNEYSLTRRGKDVLFGARKK